MLQHNGRFIQDLRCDHVDKAQLRLIAQRCRKLKSLHLCLDHNSAAGVTYIILERFFICMATTPLTNVHIHFDLGFFSHSFFWSLTQLPRLLDLTLSAYASKDDRVQRHWDKIYLSFLECCPLLERFILGDQVKSVQDPSQSLNRTLVFWWLKRTIISPNDRQPLSPVEAMSRRPTLPPSRPVADQEVLPEDIPRFSVELSEGTVFLRQLSVNMLSFNESTFLNIISRCSLLEELILENWSRLNRALPFTVIGHCPLIRDVRIRYRQENWNPQDFLEWIVYSPRFESLSLESLYFVMDPVFHGLAALQQFEIKHLSAHPLKRLALKGFFKRPIKVLSGPLALESVFISEVTLESMNHDTSVQGDEDDPYGLRILWPCSQDSLTSLDLHSLNSPSPEVTMSLFRWVQELKHLMSLFISLWHFRELLDNAIDEEPVTDAAVVGDRLDGGRLCFPSVQNLRIANRERSGAFRRGISMRANEIVEIIKVFPSLQHLKLVSPGNEIDIEPLQLLSARK